MEKSEFDLLPIHQQLIKTILVKHLPHSTKIWIFGSRATNAKKTYSDVDLIIEHAHQPLSEKLLIDLKEAFEESDLPYHVDLLDWYTTSVHFKNLIQSSRRLFLHITE